MAEETIGTTAGRGCPRCGAPLLRDQRDCGACLLETALGGEPGAAPTSAPGRQFGDYELLNEIGRGGQGVVYRARQKSLNRLVALKLAPFGYWQTETELKRFRLEAEAAAALHHPNIIPIHEIGAHEGWCYYTMPLVEGRRLDAAVAGAPLPARRAASLLLKLARAVAYAHQRGVLHRDIKPGNILIDAGEEPRLGDFGLAKFTAGDGQVTKTRDVFGTPAYMAPEQATGGMRDVTTSADIYALGAVGYEILAGQPPFVAENALEVIRQVLEQQPEAPSRTRPAVNRDLETICLKCLEKQQNQRYGSADALAEDLERFLRGEPILARPASGPEKFWRWCHRQPALAASLAFSLVLLVAVAAGSSAAALRIQRASTRRIAAEREATTQLRESYLAQARATRLSGQAGRRAQALDVLAAAARMQPSPDLRNEAIATLALTDAGPGQRIRNGRDRFERILTTPDFTRYAVVQQTGGIRIHALADHRLILRLATPPYQGAQGLFSGDGHWFAAILSGGYVQLWDLRRENGTARSEFPRVRDAPRAVAFSSAGTFAIAGLDRAIHFYDLQTGEELPAWPAEGVAQALEFDRTGRKLALLTGGTLSVWDLAARQRLKSISHSAVGSALAWHPHGRSVVAGFDNGELWSWDIVTGEEHPLPAHNTYISDVDFDPTGTLMVSLDWDGKTQYWDATLGRPAFQEQGAGRGRFSADGTRVAFLREQGGLDIAPVVRSDVYHQWTGPDVTHPHLTGVDPSPDGRWFVYADRRSWFFCALADGRQVLPSLPNGLRPTFDPAGRYVFTLTADAILRWPIASGAGSDPRIGPSTTVLQAAGSDWQRIALSPDGTWLAAVGHQRSLLVNVADPKRQIAFARGLRESFVAISPDATWVAAASYYGNGVTVWNAADGSLRRHVLTNDNALIAISPDGRTLATATPSACCWWDTGTWQLKKRFPLHLTGEPGIPVAFSHDGKLFVLAFDRQRLALVKAANGEELATLTPPQLLNVEPIVFSADDRYLVCGTNAGVIGVWDLEALRRRLAALGLDWAN